MKNFQLIAGGVDTAPLLNMLATRPELWNERTLRTQHPQTAHAEVDDIWIRFNDTAAYEATGNAASIVDQHESIWYPPADVLWPVKPMIFDLMRKMNAVRLGRVLITRLKPGRQIAPHIDGGDHAAYYERYHIVLQGLPGSLFRAGDEQVCMQTGQVWWFQNGVEHSVLNNSADDRIHIVVDLRTC